MERFRRRRSATHARVSSPVNVTTIVDQSSYKGNQLVGSHCRSKKFAYNSSTCSSIVTSEENRLSFESGRSNTELLIGPTMKKLLADEMSRDNESGRRSPSIIARLMGLDGLPAAHNTNKEQKRLSDSHQRGSGSAGFHKDSKLHDGRSHRKNFMGQQQFKDVYEVVDRSNMETRSNSSHAASNQNSCEDEIGFIRQKFMDVKRFSTNENLKHSKEYHDALEVLVSNKDLLLKFLQEPDLLFSKHLHDLHDAPESYYGYTCGMHPNNALKSNIDVIGCQAGGEASQKIDISHSHKRRTSCPSNMYHRQSTNFHKLSFTAEETEDASSASTKIVVLKPNLGKPLNIKSASSNSSCEPQSNESLNLKHLGREVRGKKSKHDDFDVYGRKSRESRELAREITRRMRNKLGVDSFNVSSSGYKGYSADESSHDTSEDDSSYESDVTFVSSHTLSNRTVRSNASASRYMESSVNMEAKKRLSERWKMTHRCQELGASSKGSTLAEMLAIPDVDIRPRSPDIVVPSDECFRRIGRNGGTTELVSPLGISSRDGWKNGCIQNLSRSRSLPASTNYLGKSKSNAKREAVAGERFPIQYDSIVHARNKTPKREFRRKEASSSESKKPSDEKSQSSCPISVPMIDDIHDVQSSGNMMENVIDDESPEVKAVILEMPSSRHDKHLALNAQSDKELRFTDEEVPSPQDCSSICDTSSFAQVGGSSCLQWAATHSESSASSKESEQPSPVSVLEAPFVEDLSSGSECFERVNAELHGLRMQLQLLKLESDQVHDEVSMLVSGDEYVEESTELCDSKQIPQVGECWESWYLVDVLTLSGLDKTDCELFFKTWHSPDCPVGPWVFEDLEKRYGELELCSRSERRLLFDHINFRIVEICQQFVDRESWMKLPRNHIGPQRMKDVLKTKLQLLEKHENKGSAYGMDTMILSDMQWMMLGEHISAVGRDIEALLIDELVGVVAESLL